MLRNASLIARRDYVAYVGRRRFWISLLLSPAILLAFILVPSMLQRLQSTRDYAVIDHSGWVLQHIDQRITADDLGRLLDDAAASVAAGTTHSLPPQLAAIAPAAASLDATARKSVAQAIAAGGPAPAAGAAAEIWTRRDALSAWYHGLTPKQAAEIDRNLDVARYRRVAAAAPAALAAQVSAGKLFAYFEIPADPLGANTGATYAARNLTDTGLRDWFSAKLDEVVRARKVKQLGLPAVKAHWLETPIRLDSQLVTKEGAHRATAAEKAAQWMPIGYVYLLYISIMVISQLLMMMTIEEKSSRVAEMLLASVSPTDIMAGKTLGVAAVGLTLIGGWLAIILGLLAAFGGLLPVGSFAAAILAGVSVWNICWFIVYFLLGFLLYAAVLGAVGAAVNNIQEAQPFMVPVIMFLILPLVLMVPVAKDPTATWARVLSYVPPLTPFLMMNRSAASPPLIDYVATTLLLAATAALALYASGRIFRIGLLNTGAPPKLKELLRWLQTPAGRHPG